MASLRGIKTDIDFLTQEVISDCYMALYFNNDPKKREEIIDLINKAVDFRNEMFQQANNPADKKNKSLVKKHYAYLRRTVMSGIDDMFGKLSDICKQ